MVSEVFGETEQARLDADGFIQLNAFLTPLEVVQLRDLCDQLAEAGDGLVNLAQNVDDMDDICPVIRRPEAFKPELAEAPGWNKLLRLGRGILGAEASLGSSAFFIKPARIGSETFWHQDEAFYDAHYDYRELKLWAALDDTDDDNSPLEYVPGSHLRGVLPHRTIDTQGICAVLADVEQHCSNVRRMLTKAGDILVHRGYMLHHAPPNRSDRIRRALVVTLMLPPTRRSEPIEMPWKTQLTV